jgi:hypothetical protein
MATVRAYWMILIKPLSAIPYNLERKGNTLRVQKGIYKNAHEPKDQDRAHARKMKVISVGTTFMGKHFQAQWWSFGQYKPVYATRITNTYKERYKSMFKNLAFFPNGL